MSLLFQSLCFSNACILAKDSIANMLEFLQLNEIIKCHRISKNWKTGMQLMKRGILSRTRKHLEFLLNDYQQSFGNISESGGVKQPQAVPDLFVSQLIGRYIQNLWLKECNNDKWFVRYIEWFRLMSTTCEIEILELSRMTRANSLHLLSILIPTCPKLKELHLEFDNETIRGNQELKQLYQHYSDSITTLRPLAAQLQLLEINYSFPFNQIFENKSVLETLILHDGACPYVDFSILPQYPIDGCIGHWTYIGYQWSVSPIAQTLKHLNISFMRSLFESEALLTMVHALPRLEILKMLGCLNVTVEFYEKLVAPQLHTLHTTHLIRADDSRRAQANRQIVAIARLPSLRVLALNSTRIVADSEWPVLLAASNSLRELIAVDAQLDSRLDSERFDSREAMPVQRLKSFCALTQLESLRIQNGGVGLFRTLHPMPYDHYKSNDPISNVNGQDVVNLVASLPKLHSLWLDFYDGLYVNSESLKPLVDFHPRFQNLQLKSTYAMGYESTGYDSEIFPQMRQSLYPIKCNELWKTADLRLS